MLIGSDKEIIKSANSKSLIGSTSGKPVEEIVLKKLKPLDNYIITTAKKYSNDKTERNGLMYSSKAGSVMEIQKIVAVSEFAKARGLKEGMDVLINFDNYGRPYQKRNMAESVEGTEDYKASLVYHIPTIDLNEEEFLKLRYNDIDFIVEEFKFK